MKEFEAKTKGKQVYHVELNDGDKYNRLESGSLALITQPLAKFAITTVMDGKGFQILLLSDIIHTTHIYTIPRRYRYCS